MTATTKGRPKSGTRLVKPKLSPPKSEPSTWKQIQAHRLEHPMDDLVPHTHVGEAFALIKHAGPRPRQVQMLTVALRLLVDETIRITQEYLFFETHLVELCELLHSHIDGFGLTPDKGRWYVQGPSMGWNTPIDREIAALFPLHSVAKDYLARAKAVQGAPPLRKGE